MTRAARPGMAPTRYTPHAFGLLAFVVALGGLAPASAQEWRHERDHARQEEWREHEWRERERHERPWHERGEYHPYVAPPPAVVYTPPVQGPAINFVFPLNLH